ncbi:MAG: UDP-N-acetylmuramoyl-L-alanine--D-glutamate ligase [Firmicutes bacterium]|nr:UDP-N-acetylmuramoyl-L-alanine--D-glutamate ligase [Bacillota bacterium]
MNYKGLNILVLGKGKTGTSTYNFLIKQAALAKLVDEVDDGPFLDINPKEYDLIVQSPGVSRQHPFLKKCDQLGVKVTNEIELAYEFVEKPIIGVTGTNGKTTIVNIIDHIFKVCNIKSALVGNVGKPFIESALEKQDVFVLELSSYQLETISNFKPKIAIISNLTPDHLERHKTMENYLKIKSRIYKNMDENNFLILNYDDMKLRNLNNNNIPTYFYSLKNKVKGIYLEDNKIILNIDGPKELFEIKELKIIGKHNIENTMAGTLAAILYGCSLECTVKGAKEFTGVEHRLEFVSEINGVKYYNDSKATNPEAAMIGIKAFEGENIFVILGGSEKEVSYKALGKTIVDNNAFAILQGNTSDEIGKELDSFKYKRYIKFSNLKEAVDYAYLVAENRDIVLLSPACASFDQFENFEKRGEIFKKYVKQKK